MKGIQIVFILAALMTNAYAGECEDMNKNDEWVRIIYTNDKGQKHTMYGVVDISTDAFTSRSGGLIKLNKTFYKTRNGDKYVSHESGNKTDVTFLNTRLIELIDVLNCKYMNKVYADERKGIRVRKLKI